MNIAKYINIILIIKFIILGVLFFILGKHVKKKSFKNISLVVVSLLTLWTIIFTVDINRTNSLKEPIFARENGYMGSMTKYNGLVYKIGLEKNYATKQISQSQMTIWGQLVAGRIDDFLNDFTIVDETKICDDALEEIYRDDNYIYYLPCIQSATIFLKYDNDEKISVKEALDDQKVSIDMLIEKGLTLHREPIHD